MSQLNRLVVLNTLIRHETLIVDDLAKEENLGFVPDKVHLQLLLDELNESMYITLLDGVVPRTYTITDKGIEEGNRLQEQNHSQASSEALRAH